MNRFVTVCAINVCLLFLSASVSAEILPAPRKLSDHVYAWIGPLEGPAKTNNGYRMNMGFVAGSKAVVVIDTGYTEAMAAEMLKHIGNITPVPVKYAINTNSQPDRFMGNEVFRRAGARVIAHKKSAARMAQRGGSFATAIERILDLKKDTVSVPAQPDELLTRDRVLDIGDVELRVEPFGAGHTPAQLVVHVRSDNIVFAGDVLYSGRMPAILEDSNTKEWLKAWVRLKALGKATFVPGHGEPAPLAAFDFSTRQYLQAIHDHMNKAVDQGIDLQTAITSFNQQRWSKLVNFNELSGRNASWAYIEREKAFFAQ